MPPGSDGGPKAPEDDAGPRDDAGPDRARRATPLRRALASPTARVLALSSLVACLGGSLWLLPATREAPSFVPNLHIPWWAIAGMVVACEVYALHIQVRREAHAISLSELAMVFGLFFASPAGYVAGRVVGSLAISVVRRRQMPLKVFFNVSLDLAETTVTLLAFHAVLGPGNQIGPRAWTSAFVATSAAAVLSAFAVTGVIAVADGQLRRRDLLLEPLRGVAIAVAVSAVALVGIHALSHDPLSAVLLVTSMALLLLAWRAYSGLSERHLSLERLYRFSHVVSSTPEVDDILAGVLQHARQVLRAEHAEIVFVSSPPGPAPVLVETGLDGALNRRGLSEDDAADPLWRSAVAGSPLLVSRGTRDPAQRAFLAARGVHDAVVAPLRGEAGIVGTILVGNRMGEVRTFDDDDVHLLETVANHAGMALRNGQLVHRLRHDALHDALTGLPNRAALSRALSSAVGEVRSGRSTGVTVMVLDLVGFKQVNDTFGHHLGDLLLREVGARMAAVVGNIGTFGRLGGDEFAAVLPGVHDVDGAAGMARAVQAALEEPVGLEGLDIEVGVSIGVATSPAHGTDGHLLMKRADAAMYEAKSSGDGPHLYQDGLEAVDTPARLALVAELRQGIGAGQLELHVQPQARLPGGEVVGAEALVRWRHPRHGLLLPDEFIPLAERSGLIRQLTTVVLEQALTACGQWWSHGQELSVAVNLSARSTLTDELVEQVASLLVTHELPSRALTLEITETSIIRDPVRTAAVLDRLHEAGVRLSIDDFGTGYSSLSYLRRLPVQELKIDKGFVSTMVRQAEDATIVRSIVDLSGNLGLAVVAEGVEDDDTWQELATMGCDLVQGYWLAAPMPLADFPAWLQHHVQHLRLPCDGAPGALTEAGRPPRAAPERINPRA